MLPAVSLSKVFRSFAALLFAIAVLPAFAQTCTTTITGKVYSPAGPTTGDPIPNILVFAYPAQLPAFTADSGPGGCTTQANLVPQTGILGAGTTNAAGTFTFSGNSIPASVNIVIQAGKWRRQYTNTAITPCTTNTLQPLSMPASQGPLNDLPHIAVVTGSVDGVECILNQIGISPSEVTTPSGTGSINFYKGDYSGGEVSPDTTTSNPTPPESTLVSNLNTMNTYDVIMFGCQGSSAQSDNTAANQANILSYTSNGGRVFTTHFEYIWLEDSFPTVATFGNFTTPSPQTQVATIDQTYPEGAILANWIQNVGASYNNTLGQIQLNNTDVNTSVVNNPPSQSWVKLNSTTYKNASMQFTFDTPIGQTGIPTVAALYNNVTTSFHPGDANDTIQINVTNSSSTATLPGLTLTISLPAGINVTSLADSSTTGGWVCSNLVCTLSSALAPSASDSVTLKFSIAANITPGPTTITSAISGGGLSGTGQCGRVLYNDYHVESQSLTKTDTYLYPSKCSTGALTAQEKFLEFSLYNLSNFVSPVASDTFDIIAYTTLTWPTPASIPYGTALSATQLDASVTVTSSGATVPGNYVYSPAAGTILDVGTQTLNVSFTPTDPTSYPSSTGSVQLVVTQDTTQTSLASSVNPSVINQSVTFTATVTGSNAAPTGTVSFYDGTTLLGTGTLTATTGDVSTATFTTSILALGSHNITAVYANTLDFGPSTSGILVQVVNLIPSTTTITGLVSPIYYGQIIGDTSFVNVVGFSAGGTTAVYIDNVLVCTLPVIAGQTNTCPPSTGAGYNAGVHTIYAMYSGDPEYAPSTSPMYSVTILPDVTTTTLVSSQNPSKQTQPVTFTATVSAPYATPVGTVNFYSNGVLIGAANLNASGVASVTTTLLAAGADNITAVYAPSNGNFNPSTSAILLQQVNPLIPRFEITITPNPLNIAVNSTGTATITVTDYDGFNQPVTLSCSGLTTETGCAFAQLLTPAGGGSTTVTLSPAPPHSCKVAQAENSSPRGPATWLALVGLALLLTRRRRRLFQAIALAALLVFLLPVVNGCGNCTDLGVLPGTYTVTITGTSTGTPVQTSSATVTMNVQY